MKLELVLDSRPDRTWIQMGSREWKSMIHWCPSMIQLFVGHEHNPLIHLDLTAHAHIHGCTQIMCKNGIIKNKLVYKWRDLMWDYRFKEHHRSQAKSKPSSRITPECVLEQNCRCVARYGHFDNDSFASISVGLLNWSSPFFQWLFYIFK